MEERRTRPQAELGSSLFVEGVPPSTVGYNTGCPQIIFLISTAYGKETGRDIFIEFVFPSNTCFEVLFGFGYIFIVVIRQQK